MTAGKFSILLGKPNHSTWQSSSGVAGGLTVGKTPSAEVVRVGVYHDASSHDATLAASIEADLFIGDVHCSLIIGGIDVAKISSMSGKNQQHSIPSTPNVAFQNSRLLNGTTPTEVQ